MAAVDLSEAEQLKAAASFVQVEGGEWRGALAELRTISPFASDADALAQAQRVSALHATPLAIDRVPVPGSRRDLIGRGCIIRGAQLGYEAGIACFILSVDEGEANTTLRVLRRL